VPDVDGVGVTGHHHELAAVGREALPGGPVAVRILEPGHGPAGGDLLQMHNGWGHLQGHELAIGREGHVAGVEGDVAAQPANLLQGVDVPEGDLVAAGDDQSTAVAGEEDVRALADNPFVDHLTRADVPEADAVRVPAAAGRPAAVAAETMDLA